MDFSKKIKAAVKSGLLRECGKVFEALGHSANWYTDKTDRIDEETFKNLRAAVDEAEALWNAATYPAQTGEHHE
jgi:hypothetical protein